MLGGCVGFVEDRAFNLQADRDRTRTTVACAGGSVEDVAGCDVSLSRMSGSQTRTDRKVCVAVLWSVTVAVTELQVDKGSRFAGSQKMTDVL